MKKKLLHHCCDTLQKIGIAGVAIALWQGKTEFVGLAVFFIIASFLFVIMEETL
jgi:hypothetical protein